MEGMTTMYDAVRSFMRNLGANPETQKTRTTLDLGLRRLADDLGTETMALVDCALRDVPLDQALTLADVTVQESDRLLVQVAESLKPTRDSLNRLNTALQQRGGSQDV